MGFGGLRPESSCTESSLYGFCEFSVIAGGVLAESSGLGRSPCGDGASDRPIFYRHLMTPHGVVARGVVVESTMLLDSARSRRARSRRCTVFCEVFVIAGGVLAESSGLERSPCGDGASQRPVFTGI